MADWDYLQLYWCWNAKDKLRWKLVTWVLIWYFGVWRTETKGMVWRCPIPHPSKWLAGDCPRCSMVDHLMSTPWRVVRRERHRQLSQNIDAKRGEFFGISLRVPVDSTTDLWIQRGDSLTCKA
jgi:hypothetical protein